MYVVFLRFNSAYLEFVNRLFFYWISYFLSCCENMGVQPRVCILFLLITHSPPLWVWYLCWASILGLLFRDCLYVVFPDSHFPMLLSAARLISFLTSKPSSGLTLGIFTCPVSLMLSCFLPPHISLASSSCLSSFELLISAWNTLFHPIGKSLLPF